MADQDIDPRLLRAFDAVARELHFTRAAARLYTAQQALSRDIRRLEQVLGAELFDRTTRRVALTAEGERLLPYARAVLAAHDGLRAAAADGVRRPLLVDVSASPSTGRQILDATRAAEPGLDLMARYYTGLDGAAADVLAGRLDVTFGRVAGLPAGLLAGLEHRPVRYEPMAVLLPAGHRLAALPAVPVRDLRGEPLYAGAGNPATAAWTALAAALFAEFSLTMAEPYPEITGEEEFVRVVRQRGWSVLASTVFADIPGMVLRPLTDPVPLSPVSLVHRRGPRHPAADALLRTARTLAAEHGWLELPTAGEWWLPREDAEAMRGARTKAGGTAPRPGAPRP
ncbi:LysR family transcriptional regulator [Streptomyces tsukubensis]